MFRKKRRKKKKVKAIQKLSRFYSLDELDDYYSVVFQRLIGMKNTVGDAFFFFLLREHERRMKKDLKALRRVEKREFSISKRLYKEGQLAGKIKPYDPPKESPIPPNPVELEALNKCMTYVQQQAQNNPQNVYSAENMEVSPVLPSGDAGNSQSVT